MADFFQNGSITTLHDLRAWDRQGLETLLESSAANTKIGLVLPVTAGDMRADPFPKIIDFFNTYAQNIEKEIAAARKKEKLK